MGLSFESHYAFQFPTEGDAKAFYEETGDETETYGAHFDTEVPLTKELEGKTVQVNTKGYGCIDLTEFNRNNVIAVTYQCWSCQSQGINFIRNIFAKDFNYKNSSPYEEDLDVETYNAVLDFFDDEDAEEPDFDTDEEYDKFLDDYNNKAIENFKEKFIEFQKKLT